MTCTPEGDAPFVVIATDHLPILYDFKPFDYGWRLVIATSHLPILYDDSMKGNDEYYIIATDHLPILYDKKPSEANQL